MLTPQQAFQLFVYADWAMMFVALGTFAASVGWTLLAILPRNKGRRRRIFLRALMCLTMFAIFWGTQASVLIHFTNLQWTPLLVVLFTLPVILMMSGIAASVAYGVVGMLRSNRQVRRNTILKSLLGVVIFGVGIAPHAVAILTPIISYEDHANYPGTLVHVDELAPDFHLTSTAGKPFHLDALQGDVIVLNFFATWCGPCQMELPHLESVWSEFRDDSRFRMLVVGREETESDVKAFQEKSGFTFPMAADPENAVYSKFATQSIPRTYLIAGGRTIVFETTGFHEPELATLKKMIRRELAKTK